ncbi:nucleolar protein 9 [Cyclospora cayetanensis]|uniref:Nucleolar protein 9 n=1 Tax=Cyclospora cayetanensis TaxID=88456 RepID=A0A1D3DAX6_9EIME|nr:nucleolar protein 9 [Cyclospora cayetanensis]
MDFNVFVFQQTEGRSDAFTEAAGQTPTDANMYSEIEVPASEKPLTEQLGAKELEACDAEGATVAICTAALSSRHSKRSQLVLEGMQRKRQQHYVFSHLNKKLSGTPGCLPPPVPASSVMFPLLESLAKPFTRPPHFAEENEQGPHGEEGVEQGGKPRDCSPQCLPLKEVFASPFSGEMGEDAAATASKRTTLYVRGAPVRKMGKRRGGQRHKKKKTEDGTVFAAAEEEADAVEALVPDVGDEEDEDTTSSSRDVSGGLRQGQKQAAPLAAGLSEYFVRIKRLIESCPFQGDLQFEAFVTATLEEIVDRVPMSSVLVEGEEGCSQALGGERTEVIAITVTAGHAVRGTWLQRESLVCRLAHVLQGLLVLSDPKCSRVVEQLISLVANFIAFQEGGRQPEFGSGEVSEAEKLQCRIRCLESYLSLMRAVAPLAPSLAVHPNGSHVLQTLLHSVPAVIEFELTQKKGKSKDEQTVEDFFLFMMHKLKSESGGWRSLMQNAIGTHIFRSAIRAAAGIDCLLPAEAAGRRKNGGRALPLCRSGVDPSWAGSQCMGELVVSFEGRRAKRRTRKDSAETLLSPQVSAALSAVLGPKAADSARLAKVPKSLTKALLALAAEATETIKTDPFDLPFDTYAAPGLQVLMLALQARQQEEALERLLDSIFCSSEASSSSAEAVVQIADALVDSPTGSRILELGLTLLSPERFQIAFSHWILKKANTLAQGRFGNFVLQKILQSSVFQAAHLKQLIQALNFGDCLFASTSAVLWRCAEACRRLQSSYKEFARKMFEAVGVRGGSATPYVWWCLLGLCTPEDLPSELLPGDEKGEEVQPAESDKKENDSEEINKEATSEHERVPLEPSQLRLQDICTPSGCSIVTSLLKFPPATIQPLSAGFKKFIKSCRECKLAVRKWKSKVKGSPPVIEIHPLLELMATNKLASRVIQEIADPANDGIQPSAVQYMIRSLLPFVPLFALDPVGGFVLTSIYNGATPESKRQIVEALLTIEEELKAQNYAAYMKCEIYRYTKSKEEWQTRQEKRSKTRDLFKDILTTPAVEEEEKEETPLPEGLMADPIAKQLIIEHDSNAMRKSDKIKKKKRKNHGEEETEIAADGPADAEAAASIDQIFLDAFDEKQRQQKHRKKKRISSPNGSRESEGPPPAAPPLKSFSSNEQADADPTLDAALFFIEGTNSSISKRELARRRKVEAEKLEMAESLSAVTAEASSRRKQHSLLVAADSRHERRGGNTAPADAAPGGNAKDGLFELVLTEPGAQESAWQYCEGGMAPLSSPRSFASSRSISSECEGVRRRRSSCDGAEDEADSAAKGGQKPRHSRPSEDDKSGCDPPHLEIISRFQRLKEIRHPHLCAYTHILRKQSRVYLVSEQWSLSLEDIMRAWERDGELHAGGSAESTPLPGNAPSCDLPKEGDNEEGAGGRLAHNRLEPRTIRLSAHGNVQLSEWGLAYLTDGGRLAPSAALPASFAFLSPEQILAGPGVLSHTAACAKQDVWSLGIILLQILQPRWLLKKPLRGKGMLQQERPSHARDGACSCVSSLHSASRSASEARAGGGEAAEASSDALEPAEKGLKNITQLVLYCALAADFKCLLPLNPPAAEEATDATSEEEEGSNSSSQLKAAAAPSVCAFGTGLQGWLLERKPLLLEMMQKAIGAPCHMISPRAFRSALKATLPEVSIHCPKELSAALSERQQHDDGYPKAQSLLTPQCAAAVSAVSAAASPPPLLLAKAPTSGGHMTGAVNAEAAEAAEAALLLHCLEGLMRWLSGESLEASPRCLSARAPAPEERSRCSDSSESNILKPPQQDAVGNTDEGDHSETLQQELLRRRRSTLLRQIREFLRASLKIHPSCRASPGDLLALEWLQTPQRERQLWCLKGAECIGVLASLHVEEELRQVVGGERKERAGDSRRLFAKM